MINIYVRLLDEGTTVFRLTSAEPIGEDLFRLLPTDDYDPEDETWECLPGTIVECEKQESEGGEILVAKKPRSAV